MTGRWCYLNICLFSPLIKVQQWKLVLQWKVGETTRGAKRLGGKRPGRKRLGGETTRGGNGLGAKRLGFQRYILSAEITQTNFLPFFFPEVLTGSWQDWGGLDYTASDKIWVSLISVTKWQEKSVNKCHEHILPIIFIIYYRFSYIYYFIPIFIL